LYLDKKPSFPVSSLPVRARDIVGSAKNASKGVPAD